MITNIDMRNKAIALRRNGESYNNIVRILNIKSKGTLSYWLKNIKLSKQTKKLLEKNNELAHKRGLFVANKNRRDRIDAENNTAYAEGFNLVGELSNKDLILIGASLYWGEGTKSERNSSTPLVFSNSDPSMIAVYMKFIRTTLKISEEKIRAGIHIYSSISPTAAKKYWSSITKLPENIFYIVNQVSRASQGKRPFNMLPYGTAVIKVSSRVQFHKVKGMISGLSKHLI